MGHANSVALGPYSLHALITYFHRYSLLDVMLLGEKTLILHTMELSKISDRQKTPHTSVCTWRYNRVQYMDPYGSPITTLYKTEP